MATPSSSRRLGTGAGTLCSQYVVTLNAGMTVKIQQGRPERRENFASWPPATLDPPTASSCLLRYRVAGSERSTRA